MPKKKKHKQGHNMPIGLQKYIIRKIIEKLYPWIDDPDLLPLGDIREVEWEDYVDPKASLPENMDDMERIFGKRMWIPKRADNKPLRYKEVDKDEEGVLIREEVIIKRHPIRAKGKLYERGRIQVGLDKRLVGCYALVQVYVPKTHTDTIYMSRFRAEFYTYQHENQWKRLFDNRYVRPKTRKEVIPDQEGVLIRTEIIIKRNNQFSLKNLTGQYALVQVTIPKSHVSIEGMPHVIANKYLEQALRLAELDRDKRQPPKHTWQKKRKESKYKHVAF